MKELSIKEKAKRYDEAMDKAKKELDACGSQDCDAARQIFRLFPELIEPEDEDEKIRKTLINVFATHKDYEIFFGISVKDILAWLEKQGETFTKKDVDDAWLKGMCDAKQELEKQCGQNPAWSEEDEKMVNNILTPLAGRFPWNIYQPMYDWLKALKGRIGG